MRFSEYISQPPASGLKGRVAAVASMLIDLCRVPQMPQSEERSVKAHDKTIVFWTNPDSPLFPWLRSHGVTARPGIVPPHTSGSVGRVYFCGGNNVVKMSSNRVEANVAKMVAGRDDLPTPIIDVLPLTKPFYAILQHFVNTNIPIEIKRAADYVMVLLDNNPGMQGFPRGNTEREALCKDILKKYKGSFTLLPHMLMLMDVVSRLYEGTGFMHDDAGPTNVALHRGRVVIPDLGPNETGKFDPTAAMDQITRNRANLGLGSHDAI